VECWVELKGDRVHGDDGALVGGVGTLGGRPVVVLGHQRGRDTKENVARNFGMPRPEAYRKALRLMRLAEKFGFPLVCLVDTPGADPGMHSEERGQAFAIAAERWPRDGRPSNPPAWLVTTARNRAIDRIRRDRARAEKLRLLAAPDVAEAELEETTIPDARLELLFTCCHPALALDAQVAAGRVALDRAVARGCGPYVLQGAIAALHAEEPQDWPQIAALYGELARLTGSPIVELNRAAAIAARGRGRRPRAHRPARAWQLPLPALDARRAPTPTRPPRRGPRRIRASAGTRSLRRRAALPRAETGSARGGDVDVSWPQIQMSPIGRVQSQLKDPALAPRQADEGAPDAWLIFEPAVVEAMSGIRAGEEIIVLTWLHRARRDVLRVHPRGDDREFSRESSVLAPRIAPIRSDCIEHGS
jgi:hypothetical protein